MNTKSQSGFTIAEIIIALAIIILLLGIGATTLVRSRTAKQLDTITDSIAAKLEEAKANALSGKNGANFGVAFASTSYTYWSGTSYNPSDVSNTVYNVANNFMISTTLSGSSVRFSRITGTPNVTGTITISKTGEASTTDSISIGTLGDITVIK